MSGNAIEGRSMIAVNEAMLFTIENSEQNLMAANNLKAVQLLQKEVSAAFDPIIEKAHFTHKEAIAQKNKYAHPLKQAEQAYKKKIGDFYNVQEAIRIKEENRLRKIAEDKELKLKEKAAVALKAGNEAKAEKLIEKAAEIPVPVVAPTFEKPKNVSVTKVYKGLILNEHLIPRELNGMKLMIPDQRAINKLANVSKGTISIPGVKIVVENQVSGRTV